MQCENLVLHIHSNSFGCFPSRLQYLICHFCLQTQIGGMEEYKICQGIREGRISKPVVSWCIGTCATKFTSEVRPALPPSHCHCSPHESRLRSYVATCRYSSAMRGPAPTMLQKRRWPRTRPCGTPGPTSQRALTSLVTSLGEAVRSHDSRLFFLFCFFSF